MRHPDETPRGVPCAQTGCNKPATIGLLCEEHDKRFSCSPRVPAQWTCRWCSVQLPERTPEPDAFCTDTCRAIYEEQQYLKPGDSQFIPRNATEAQEHKRERRGRLPNT